MTEDNKELVEYLDVKFGKLEDKLDRKAEKSEVNEILANLDAYAKQADTYFQEHILLAGQVSRHERWHERIAKRLGMKLEY